MLSDTKFMITCLFTTYVKITNVCSKVFVECIIRYAELEGTSTSYFQLAPLAPEASTTLKNWRELALRVFDTLIL